ncbi:MAG: ankyrin repeat domain-containing protein [Acidobacteriota bacterium]|nr:ankyrin repeat domain-containing protein [Acidobacteriota bacterium]
MRFALMMVLFLGCARPYAGFTPLADASRAGDVATIRTLISQGADPNAVAGNNNWTPLMHAIHKAQIKSVEALLDGGADPNKTTGDGFTALMMAAGYGYTDIVQLLLRRGANPRLAAADGVRPIDLAVAGVADIDQFTLFQCHEDTIAALRAADPSISLRPRTLMWARAKRCRV